jgi:nucleoside-triphosphatase THEP1
MARRQAPDDTGIAAPPRSPFLKQTRFTMFDAECDLAALVYGPDQDPDAVLRDFASELNARGFRAVGMVQAGQCADSSLSAVLIHNGETLLLAQDFDPRAKGCRLDIGRLERAGERVAGALDGGADLLIVNRFGKRERDGKGLSYLIERALKSDIPVVIAVSSLSFAEWIKFAGGMSVKLACDRGALDAWWNDVAMRRPRPEGRGHQTVCEVLK